MTLSAYLKMTGKTYASFGAEVGAPERTVGKWVRGERIPRDANITKIARVTENAVTANDFHEAAAQSVAA